MRQADRHIWIVGAGITGLATAYYLSRLICEKNLPWKVSGIEASDRLGGMIQTHSNEYGIIERGPDCFSTDRPVLLSLCKELGLEDELIEPSFEARGLWLREGSRFHQLPPEFGGLTAMKLSTLARLSCLSLKAKIRLACEFFIPRRKGTQDESLGEFIGRRFGEETLQRLAQPFLGSIFGSDLRQISLRAIFPHWIAMEEKYGSLTWAALTASRNRSVKPVVPIGFRTLRGGLEKLAQTLHEQTPVSWQLGKQVQNIFQSGGEFWHLVTGDAHISTGDAVCLAVPSLAAASLLAENFPNFAEKIHNQPARSVVLVSAIFRKEDWPDSLSGSGIVSDLDENQYLQGASFSTFKFTGRTSPEHRLVRLFESPLHSDKNLNLSDQEIQNRLVKEFKSLTGVSGEPLWVETVRYKQSLPIYDLNYLNWKKNVENFNRGVEGLYLAGQSYQSGGLSGCVLSAEQTAHKIVNDLLGKKSQAENFAAVQES